MEVWIIEQPVYLSIAETFLRKQMFLYPTRATVALDMAARIHLGAQTHSKQLFEPPWRQTKCVPVSKRDRFTPRAGLLALDTSDDLSQPGDHSEHPKNRA